MTVTSPTRASVATAHRSHLLKPEATAEWSIETCKEGADLGVVAVCVSPSRVALAVGALRRLSWSPPARHLSLRVVGFPSGAHLPRVKASEAELAVAEGAARSTW